MSFFQNFDWSFKNIAKIVGLFLLGLLVVMIVVSLVSFSFRTIFQSSSNPEPYYDTYNGGYAVEDSAMSQKIGIVPPQPGGDFSTGENAEAFEVKTLTATIRTRKLANTCETIAALKSRDDVIFETANQNEENCYYRFKVKKDAEAEILSYVEKLKPEDINENVQTIKGRLETVDKQLEILENKLTSVEETLENSQNAYDELTTLATQKQDVESLTKIIDSKLNLIEKLTTQRIQIKEQIDYYNQNKADQLDRLNYSFFNVNVYKDLILDWKVIKDSWKFELKAFVNNVNDVIQGISVNLLTYFIRFFQVAIYFFLSILLLKYAWMATKKIWKR